jgi:CheY-like chemotaxis protein
MKTDNQPKILLVDDEESILSTLKLFLSLSGFPVVTAGNGAEALDQVTVHHPDLVVLDVLMPQLDGRETLWRLRPECAVFDRFLLLSRTGTDHWYLRTR